MRPHLPPIEAALPYLKEIDERRIYSNMGPLHQRFKEKLQYFLQVPTHHLVLTCNGTMALQIALEAQTQGKQGYCLVPSWTFSATIAAVIAAGLTPLFVDVDQTTWMLDRATVDLALDRYGKKIVACVAVTPFGEPIDTRPWDALTQETGLPVVLDAAASYEITFLGSTTTTLSLHATKMLGIGEGGVILTPDAEKANFIQSLTQFGFQGNRISQAVGHNAKLNEYAAAMGLAMLDYLPQRIALCQERAHLYRRRFEGFPLLTLQKGWGETWTNLFCHILSPHIKASVIQEALAQEGIESRCWWATPCHLHPAYHGYPTQPLPITQWLADHVLGVPFYEDIPDAHIQAVMAVLERIHNSLDLREAS
jgi:dTDP-4-amino-4,6-dideoxygalactose transaminase